MDRLRVRFRLVVLNDETFEERFSLRLTPGGFLILIGSITIVMTFLVISLIAFTPLREYIPGYGNNTDVRREILNLARRTDSLESAMAAKDWYIQNLNNVLSGNLETQADKPRIDSSKNYKKLVIKPSKEDSALRQEIEKQDKYSLNVTDKNKSLSGISAYVLFSPVKGKISHSFNLREGHYGVDVAAAENEFIKSTLDGTVVFGGWTNTDGYVIQVQHQNNIMSVYKHCSALLKKTGDIIKAGEAIAIVGNSGETSYGTHLHFELWYNGNPINPQNYIVF